MKKFLLILFLVVLSLSSCTKNVYPHIIEEAKERCSKSGGIYRLEIHGGSDYLRVTCKDSTYHDINYYKSFKRLEAKKD